MEKELYKWKYILDGEVFRIIPDKVIKKPDTFYKYYPMNHYSIDSLVNSYVYASHPSDFNDIFDCYADLLDFDKIELIRNFLVNVFPMYSNKEFDEKVNENYLALKGFSQDFFKELMYKRWGIFSMTEESDNLLMWSYYNSHIGYCIEFDILNFPFEFHGPFQINYQPIIDSMPLSEISFEIGVLAQSNLKDIKWKHENEWRLLIKHPEKEQMISPHNERLKSFGGHNRKFNYPLNSIKSIRLGTRFFLSEEIQIINVNELEINLKNNFEQKLIVLDFLSDNNILTYFGQVDGFNKIKFDKVKVSRVNYRKFNIASWNE